MFKIIRNILIILAVAVIGFAAFQFKLYNDKMECRENALLYFQEEDYEKAIGYLEEGLDGFSFFYKELDTDMNCYLAESYFQLGDYEKAVEIYNSLLESKNKEKKYYVLKGEAFFAMGESEKAIKTYEKGWEITKDPQFLTKICDSYLITEDYENALVYAQKGSELDGEEAAEFLFMEVVIYERWQDYQTAYEMAVKYNELYPDDEKGIKEVTFLETRI